MSKNVIHNFNLSIKNSADIKSSEHLAETVIKEMAKVSKEMSEQKDIVQVWHEQNQNISAVLNNFDTSTEGGATGTLDGKMKNPIVPFSTTPSALEGKQSSIVLKGTLESSLFTASTTALIEGRSINNSTLTSITPLMNGAENDILNKGLTSQIYSGIFTQQNLLVPQNFQTNSNEPAEELVKAEIKKKLDIAAIANDLDAVNYWTAVYKAFDEGATVKDFNGKPDHVLFTQMYALLRQVTPSVQNFNWEITRKKMIEAIEANILKGEISSKSKDRWTTIKDQLANDKTNIANLFERYDELFLLLKEVEGLDALPNTITITTKTKIYPNLSADKLYAAIGKEDVYVFLKQISNEEIYGSGVLSDAVKIKNTNEATFIVGESLEFFLAEAFLKQKLYKKENINWVVYKNGKKEGTDFVNEGTSFTYNFDTPGTYKIEAYGISSGANNKKTVNDSAFVELRIIAQEIQIKTPANVTSEFTRAFDEEKSFKVSLKHTAIKTLNPLKLYYQLETTTANKIINISEELELDPSGIIKLVMPALGTYSIKIVSKDQYALVKEFKTSVIKNEVTSIGLAEKTANNNVFLLGIPDNKITLEAKKFKINTPTDAEKEDVRWMIYDSNNKPYLSPGTVLFTDKKDSQKNYIHKWNSFMMSIPQKVGNYTIEAFSERQKGAKSECVYKMEVIQPKITEAYWAWSGGSKKITSGFSGESNYIKANIPYYTNQTVRIYFYLDKAKTNYYLDVKTNEDGAVFKEIKFDSAFQKLIGFQKSKNDKIGFKIIGIQNSKPYPFKPPVNYESDTVLSVTTDKKILDVYFTYDGSRVKPEDEVPFGIKGAIVTIVAKTQNMVGEEIVLTAHKVGEKPSFSNKAKVSSEGVATTKFILINLDKKLKNGSKIKYYAGTEKYSTKHLTDKVLTMVIGEGKKKVEEVNNDIKLQEARIRAFLRMIRVGEGTTESGGYEKLFGGSSFIKDYKKTWKDHPRILIKAMGKNSKGKGKEYNSTASGAYQILEPTWDVWGTTFREFYGIKDFSPESQDKFTLVILKHKLLKNNKVVDVIRLIREDKIEEAVKLCGNEWASLPNSPHGQPTVTWNTAIMKYNEFLKEELKGKSSLAIKPGFLKDLGYGDDQKNEISNDVELRFTGKSANKTDLSFKTINLIKEIASLSKNFTINVTSTKRATHDQARIMYENCRQTGGKYQKDKVYNNVGDQIIEVYILEAEIGKKAEEIVIKKMEEKIIELGAENVSKHLGNYIFLETFDIQYSGLSHPKAFKKEFEKRKELDGTVLYESKNNCYHIQVNQ